jgi:hypothetical protein
MKQQEPPSHLAAPLGKRRIFEVEKPAEALFKTQNNPFL